MLPLDNDADDDTVANLELTDPAAAKQMKRKKWHAKYSDYASIGGSREAVSYNEKSESLVQHILNQDCEH